MQPCSRCGAIGVAPCVTAAGNIATSWHKARTLVVRSPRQLEQAVLEAVDAAMWVTSPIDTAKVETALTLARKIDDAIWRAERNAEGSMFADAALDEGGGITYDVDVFGRVLDSLGLSPKGRKELNIDDEETAADDIDRIINLVG